MNRYACPRSTGERILRSTPTNDAAERWRRKVLERRGSRHKRSFTPGLAREYDLKLQLEGYPGGMIERVLGLLGEDGTLLDVGGGTGLWALPIARLDHRVTVVEPGEAMRSVLQERLDAEPELPVRTVAERWEDADVTPHSVVLCAHAIYGMDSIEAALTKMERAAGRAVALYVRTGRWPGQLSSELVASLGGKPLPTCNWSDLKQVLDARGTVYDVVEVGRSVDPSAVSLTGFPEATAWLEERVLRPTEQVDCEPSETLDVWVTWPGKGRAGE